ncbi:MAG: TrmH family RNA methyltransferase [Candidatus Competibacteraceae bacterium]|jgi:tRNA G18 (ribose-2'-O)-methylase SpoU|nr:TrmH family RNA methyltransferase [Candidatus Competibacteraceae bacterium]
MSDLQLDHSAHRHTATKYPLCLLANDIDLPMNIGSLFRIADALGIEKIYLSGRSATPPNSKINRTARSTEKYVPYAYEQNALIIVTTLKQAGYTIVSLEITANSIELDRFSLAKDEKVCLILGAEKQGVGEQLLAVSDATIHIPMLGVNSSLNVATAGAIAAYAITRQFQQNQFGG